MTASSLYAEIKRLIENKQLPEAKIKCAEYLRFPGSLSHNKYQEVKNMQGFLPSSMGVYKDPRDGVTYGWIKMGNQTWMTEDLRYFTSDSKAGYSGQYYTWKEAQDVCPPGWRLPGVDDWFNFKDNLPGETYDRFKQLVLSQDTTSGFTNLTGFSARLGGIFDTGTTVNNTPREWSGQNEFSQWWTTDEENRSRGNCYIFALFEKSCIIGWLEAAKAHYMTVRCIR